MRIMRAPLRLAVLVILPLSTLGFLCLPALNGPAPPYTGTAPAGSFVLTPQISVSPTTAGAPGTLTFGLGVAAGSLLPAGITLILPAGWGVATDANIPDGAQVGSISGTFTASNDLSLTGACDTQADYVATLADATTNTSSAAYPSYLKTVAPGTHKARYYGETNVEGLAVVGVNVLVDILNDGRHQLVVIAGNPTAPPNYGADLMCSPWNFTLTLQGTASSGQSVFTNPAAGTYNLFGVVASEWDADNDGIGNGLDNCPLTANANQLDTDGDRIGDACDPQPSTQTLDIDADTIPNGFDNCPLVANTAQADADADDLGDACDPQPSIPNGTRYVLKCDRDIFIGVGGSDVASCGTLTQPVVTPTPTPTPTPLPGIDTDGDGVPDASDNCPLVPNPSQTNTDSFIDLSPPKAFDDLSPPNSDLLGDACDPDDDNDGLSDADELSGAACGGIVTDPLRADTDGDLFLDGAECALGTNPADVNSRPTLAACGSTADTDGDGVLDQREFCFYNTSITNPDTDGDGCRDGKEVASVNAGSSVDVIDLSSIASEMGIYTLPASAVKADFDATKNGSIDVIDLSFVAGQFGHCS
jgi:hypothetical protein